MNDEIWKDVMGYEGYYQVSNHGRVRSLMKREAHIRKEPRIKKHGTLKNGYKLVILWKKFKLKNFLVSRLVALHFIPNPLGLREVNHIDCDKSNNAVSNLEWVSSKENKIHAIKHGLSAKGSRMGTSKLDEDDVLAIRTLFTQTPQETTAALFGVQQMTISKILRYKMWTNIEHLKAKIQ